MGYIGKLKKDIGRWRESGLIDGSTAQALLDDAEANSRRRFSFGTVLSILAAILLGAALLLLIAANWEAFPRLLRVAMVFAVMLGGYGGGAVLMKRDHAAFAEGLWLIAAIAFGGGIALIAQMYHLSGEEADAYLIWGVGTTLAAAALRSGPLTVGAVLLAAFWMAYLGLEGGAERGVPLIYPLYAVVIWAVSVWTGSISARHAILLSLMLFACLIYFQFEFLSTPLALAALSGAVFAVAAHQPEVADRITGMGNGLALQGLVGFGVGMTIVQADLYEGHYFLLAAAVTFGGVIAALLIAGRDNRPLRWLAYAGFLFELGIVYVVLLGSMLGTSGFFLAAGLILALLAWVIGRIERRMANTGPKTAGAAA